jgi:glycogen operon protein
LPGEPGFALWLQWVADAQFAAAAEAAHRAGLTLGIYRDLALGCAYEGGEVASDPGLFATGVSIGSPPDPFSAAGQVWNLPPMIPQRLAERHFRPWQALLEANMRHAGLLRIDHVLGLQRQFWVPRGAEGRDGAYVAQPLPLLAGIVALESQRARCAVIGEDLGTVPDGLRAMMGQTGMLSCTMMWFERNGDQFTPPRDYPARSLVALSSHDLTPFHGWQATAPASEKAALNDAADDAGSGAGDLIVRAHAMVASSPAALMQVQADDLTAEQLPLNRPGTDREYPNWRRRLSQTVENIGTTDEATAILSAVRAARPELR